MFADRNGSGQHAVVGPRPFETGEHLFGREREIAELYYLLSAKRIVLLQFADVRADLLQFKRTRSD